MMAACCKCCRTGVCRNCSCVKNGQRCLNCFPGRLGSCVNQDTLASQVAHDRSGSCVDHNGRHEALRRSSRGRACRDRSSSLRCSSSSRSSDGSHSSQSQSSVPDLPPFSPLPDESFVWGCLDSSRCSEAIDTCYGEAVHWVRNLFKIPSGNAGKAFVRELCRLFCAYNNDSGLARVALKAAFLFPILVLQKPHQRSKTKEHTECLTRRLLLWKDGLFFDLLRECRTIQKSFRFQSGVKTKENLVNSFSRFMFEGKVKAAIRCLNQLDSVAGQPLSLSSLLSEDNPSLGTVHDALKQKHPEPGCVSPEHVLLPDTPPPNHDPHFVFFDQLDGLLVRRTVLTLNGAAGPSGLDAACWKRICTSFSGTSDDICESIASLARKLCREYIDPTGVSALLSCRLIALDKAPGVRPIGVGEVCRRLISKAILKVIKPDIIDVTGCLQLCAGQESGCEAAVHAIRKIYDRNETDGLLFVDASNAFNCLNRQVALRNVLHLCPSLGRVLVNFYRDSTDLFIDGDILLSKEGTTQGDPLAMCMFAIATIPLIWDLAHESSARQVWYADDSTAGGYLVDLKKWWDKLSVCGPHYGYFPNPQKTVLVVKKEYLDYANDLFSGSGISITTEGKQVLGSPIGLESFVSTQVNEKVQVWIKDVMKLAEIAQTQPQAAYSAFIHGISSKWTYFFRTSPINPVSLKPLEDAICLHLIPALTGRESLNGNDRDWLSLPLRLGGLGLRDVCKYADQQWLNSLHVTHLLVNLIFDQKESLPLEVQLEQRDFKKEVSQHNKQEDVHLAHTVRENLTIDQQRLFVVSNERGSSSWLSALPLRVHGFDLHKEAFRDALCIRYGWRPPLLPLSCVCGKSFSVEHALSCRFGGFSIQRHDEIRDLSAMFMRDISRNVRTEPPLQPLTGEHMQYRSANIEDGARLDISAEDFWGDAGRAFFDVRVFNPLAPSLCNLSLQECFKRNEREKMRQYDQRVHEIEFGTFTPLVFSTNGGSGPLATVVYKRIAMLMSQKLGKPYSQVMNFIRCRLSFSLIRSIVRCLRGTRVSRHTDSYNIDLALSEGRVFY